MLTKTLSAAFMIFGVLMSQATAQVNLETCNVVFSQGIRDNYYQLTERQQFEFYQHRLCDARLTSYQSFRDTAAGLELSIPLAEGLLGLGGSAQQKEGTFATSYQNFCASTYFDSQHRERYQSFISQVSSALTSSWNRCQELQLNAWLQSRGAFVAITPFGQLDNFLVEVRVRPTTTAPTIIRSIGPEGRVECVRNGQRVTPNTSIDTYEFQMTCVKHPALEMPFVIETNFGTTPQVTIPAGTSKILEITDKMDDLRQELARNTQAILPVGTIVISTMSSAQFQAQFGNATVRWALCDGQSYPNSAWARVGGTPNGRVPDLSGRYPRGYRNGLTPNAGDHQEDAVADHSHVLGGWAVMNDARGGGDNQVARTGYGGEIGTSGVRGRDATETRPKTTVVNFFIRVE